MTFDQKLKQTLKQIRGRRTTSLSGPSNFIKIVLASGKEYPGVVKEVDSDNFTITVTYAGGGEDDIVIKMDQVASFTQ